MTAKDISMAITRMYSDKTIAVRVRSELGGVEILHADSDRVVVRDNYGIQARGKAHSAVVRHNAKGEPYFKHNGRREYLCDYSWCR